MDSLHLIAKRYIAKLIIMMAFTVLFIVLYSEHNEITNHLEESETEPNEFEAFEINEPTNK